MVQFKHHGMISFEHIHNYIYTLTECSVMHWSEYWKERYGFPGCVYAGGGTAGGYSKTLWITRLSIVIYTYIMAGLTWVRSPDIGVGVGIFGAFWSIPSISIVSWCVWRWLRLISLIRDTGPSCWMGWRLSGKAGMKGCSTGAPATGK